MTESKPGSREFEMEIRIDAPRDAVWAAISSDVELQRWFAPKASVDLQPGGEIVWEWAEHHVWPQRIEILEPGQRLRTRYDSKVDAPDGGKAPLFVDFFLEGDGGSTTLRLVQSGFGSAAGFDEEYDGISRGWPIELRSLKLYLENHAGADRRHAWSMLDLDLDATEAWQRLTGPAGFACGPEVETMAEGERFRFVTADGDEFAGTALVCLPREFSGDAKSHGGGFFRICVEEWAGQAHVWLWLASYHLSDAELSAIEQRWDGMLQRLFVTNGETVAGGASS